MRVTFGAFVFDSRARTVARDGAPLDLSPKAFRLLEALIEARPAPVSTETLYDRLWPNTFVEPGNLHTLVAEIRRHLGDRDHTIVRTMHGVGYAFDPPCANPIPEPSCFALKIGEKEFELAAGENIVGRHPDSAVVLDSADVSRQHARLVIANDRVTIEDLGSKNGTFVDGARLSAPQAVFPGERIVFGKTLAEVTKIGSVASTATVREE